MVEGRLSKKLTIMSTISVEWTAKKLDQLKFVTESYSSQEKEQIRLSYLNNLLSRLIEFGLVDEDVLLGKIESVVNCLPKEFDEFIISNYQPLFYDLEIYVKKRFNLIPQNYHRNNYNPFSTTKLIGYILCGITTYLITTLWQKPALAIGVGSILLILVNILTGILLDKKAQRENRVL